MGYLDGVKGYKIWCLESKTCIISRDVTFNERILQEPREQNQAQGGVQQSLDRLEIQVEPYEKKITQGAGLIYEPELVWKKSRIKPLNHNPVSVIIDWSM